MLEAGSPSWRSPLADGRSPLAFSRTRTRGEVVSSVECLLRKLSFFPFELPWESSVQGVNVKFEGGKGKRGDLERGEEGGGGREEEEGRGKERGRKGERRERQKGKENEGRDKGQKEDK